ncbi:hypothetical protein M427DRAFT_46286 [Gonapodya prolifera JEL478]|uniref:Uncharacterized protein n=1 Tax=Gonapodya prolifera (strain JEL478) TaxID=1344416 RepID=A0A139A6T7_GONPJ|nr:hypothetical protein M427DRAFT_46286 [Gonapodya prolifera JEL478]|eukprot:KXS12527.1 hypothetical protein M427DRAFT_46286 [Gonapodya prolifera JEL478]
MSSISLVPSSPNSAWIHSGIKEGGVCVAEVVDFVLVVEVLVVVLLVVVVIVFVLVEVVLVVVLLFVVVIVLVLVVAVVRVVEVLTGRVLAITRPEMRLEYIWENKAQEKLTYG